MLIQSLSFYSAPDARLATTEVTQRSALFAPPPMQEIFEPSAQAELEIFQLLGGLIFQSLCHAIKDPTLGGKVRLHYAHAAAAEFRAFTVWKRNVIDEAHGNPR